MQESSDKQMDKIEEFRAEVRDNIEKLGAQSELRNLSLKWMRETVRFRYSYNFAWMGRPIIQYPQDIVALQEIIWRVQPDVIVETGIAHGGSLIFYASMLALLGGDREIIGIDIDIRPHNREAIQSHPMSDRIRMIEGSSVAPNIVQQVQDAVANRRCPLLVLDSNHTHDHVLQELRLYSPMVRKDSYAVVLDTIVEDMPADFFPDRPWGQGNSPKTAVNTFLKENSRFQIDAEMDGKLLLTVAPGGYLRCIRD